MNLFLESCMNLFTRSNWSNKKSSAYFPLCYRVMIECFRRKFLRLLAAVRRVCNAIQLMYIWLCGTLAHSISGKSGEKWMLIRQTSCHKIIATTPPSRAHASPLGNFMASVKELTAMQSTTKRTDLKSFICLSACVFAPTISVRINEVKCFFIHLLLSVPLFRFVHKHRSLCASMLRLHVSFGEHRQMCSTEAAAIICVRSQSTYSCRCCEVHEIHMLLTTNKS